MPLTASKIEMWTMAMARLALGGGVLSVRMALSSTPFQSSTTSAPAGAARTSAAAAQRTIPILLRSMGLLLLDRLGFRVHGAIEVRLSGKAQRFYREEPCLNRG